uniref:Phosphodiester glycosidase family protein n=1 Tax=Oscillatoriales cyanobacterium SpSt-418 TaxID=2282169 RepID=A0A7C3KF88_9CYAN
MQFIKAIGDVWRVNCMEKRWLRCWLLGLVTVALAGCVPERRSKAEKEPAPPPKPELSYERRTIGLSDVHIIRIPAGAPYRVLPAISDTVDNVATFAKREEAIAVLNGGYFDPVNQKSTSFVVLKGKTVANPQDNERLVNNLEMAPYLTRIMERPTFRRYRCAGQIRYDIAPATELAPPECRVLEELGAGPTLLPQLRAEEEAFTASKGGVMTRDPIGINTLNARSAVGLAADNSVILVMVAQLPQEPYKSGMPLPALAGLMRDLGAVEALNLDGGTSSALFFQGKTHIGKVAADGSRLVRPVKSVLVVQDTRRN